MGYAPKGRLKRSVEFVSIRRVEKAHHAKIHTEVQAMHSLDHPNVLKFHAWFATPNHLWVVTEYCAGGDLFTAIERAREAGERFAEADIVRWTAQIASALSYLHANKILHRDLKTQNIFLTKDGEVRVGDLGLSKVLEHTSDLATTVAGTPFYLAPEICQNRPYSTASDVWSLGCVVYELATLKHAFDGASLLSLVYSILQGDYERVGAPYSPELSALVDVCLQADPAAYFLNTRGLIGAGYGGSLRSVVQKYGCKGVALNLSVEENKRNREKLKAAKQEESEVVDGARRKSGPSSYKDQLSERDFLRWTQTEMSIEEWKAHEQERKRKIEEKAESKGGGGGGGGGGKVRAPNAKHSS